MKFGTEAENKHT